MAESKTKIKNKNKIKGTEKICNETKKQRRKEKGK